MGAFVLGYGVVRFLIEFVRLPDAQLGYLAGGWLTMGQLLCVPLFVAGGVLLAGAFRFNRTRHIDWPYASGYVKHCQKPFAPVAICISC